MKISICALAAVVSALIVSGCHQEYSLVQSTELVSTATPTPTATPSGHSFTDEYQIKVAGPTKVDLLMVVDNSKSMKDDQVVLSASLDSFISKFTQKGVDYHIAVISTDDVIRYNSSYGTGIITDPTAIFYGFINPFPTSTSTPQSFLTKYLDYKVLTPSTPDVVSKFKQNVLVGDLAGPDERIIYDALLALEPQKLAGDNKNFLRPDSLISIIGVSDENEQIKSDPVAVDGLFDHTETTPQQRIDRFKSRMNTTCVGACLGWRVDLVVNLAAPTPAKPVTYPIPGGASYPDFYLKFAAQTGTQLLDIKKSGWGDQLAKVADDIIHQAEKEFKISYTPIAGSMHVYLDGAEVPASSSNGYIYHADRLTIELTGSFLTVSPGKTLQITFQY